MPDRFDFAVAHLALRLGPVHRALRTAVDRQTVLAERLAHHDVAPFCVTAEQAGTLLDRADRLTAAGLVAAGTGPEALATSNGEDGAEHDLRRTAAAAGWSLPLDELSTRFQLSRVEQDVLLLTVAPALDRGYERVYAYILDDLNRRSPSVDLILAALAGTPAAEWIVRRLLGPAGRLRRYGLLHGAGPGELVPAPGLVEFVLGTAGDPGLIGQDPDEVVAPPGYLPPPQLEPERLARLAYALAGGQLDLVGLWGGGPDDSRDAVLALALHIGCPVRTPSDNGRLLDTARVAAALGALLWVPTDELTGTAAVDLLVRSRIPAVLTGTTAWRPARVLAARAYAELDIPAPDHRQRRAVWSATLPDLDAALLDDLAARYRMNGEELRAIGSVARAGARFAGNGRPAPLAEHVPPAVAAVLHRPATGGAQAITPRRTFDDLVLAPEQYRHVKEIASAFRAWPRVAEMWGFGRRTGDTGVKVLFTGEPGTGKTLSAEILAGSVGLQLLKVELSQVVSKWIGETEKNLESAFRQAEESQAVLLFDEADSLFGKRGEVKHGTDRYANLEVGYLLQRLESSNALVILATNLRDNIDAAFTRRFHFVVNFTRPGPEERRRLWRLAFPPEAPLDKDVDVDALSRLDMTGAGIASSARSAALIAADSIRAAICMRDIVTGVARQYQREARLLRAAELGPYAHLLTDPVPDQAG